MLAHITFQVAEPGDSSPGPSGGWSWKPAPTKGNNRGMSAREGHSAVAVESMLVVFGGCFLDKYCFNDINVLDTNKMRWVTPVVDGERPAPREGHSAALVGTSMYVFGGSGEVGYLNDVQVLDLEPTHLGGLEPHMASRVESS